MAKISRYGGASDKTLPAPEGGARVIAPTPMVVEKPHGGAMVPSREVLREHARNLVEPDHAESLAHPDVEGGEESSPGSSSSASTETPQPNSEPSSKQTRKPARKTASRSVKALTESGSAPSTDGAKTADSSTADNVGD